MAVSLDIQSAQQLSLAQLLRLALKKLALEFDEGRTRVWLDEEPSRLHGKFRDLHDQVGEHLPALGRLHFLSRGPFPYSRELSVALEVLQQSGAINRENPDYNRFSPRVFDDTRATIEPEIDRLFPPESAARDAFDRFVIGLRDLVTDE